LHRANLTKLERAEQIEEWRKLTADKKVLQLVTPSGGAQPTEAGVRETARELGISAPEVSRSSKIASISDEAKEAAKEAGIDNNQSALLKVAAADDQVKAVEEIVEAKVEPEAVPRKSDRDPRAKNERATAEMIVRYIPADMVEPLLRLMSDSRPGPLRGAVRQAVRAGALFCAPVAALAEIVAEPEVDCHSEA
jgi:hypothetical protein